MRITIARYSDEDSISETSRDARQYHKIPIKSNNMITTSSYTKTRFTTYELSKNNTLNVTYWETDVPEAEDRENKAAHSPTSKAGEVY